jgi:hypothetical protein
MAMQKVGTNLSTTHEQAWFYFCPVKDFFYVLLAIES